MHPKKQRDKNRRRANRMAEEAWQAADEGNYLLAVKIIRRAVELNQANPMLWQAQGTLLLKLQQDEPAAQAFQAAIQVAPTFAEAYAGLAGIRARQGKMELAVNLQREAVRHAPGVPRHQHALASYEALLADGCAAAAEPGAGLSANERSERAASLIRERWPQLASRIDALDWSAIADQLTAQGAVSLPGLLVCAECESLRSMFGDDRRFSKTVVMNKDRFGKGTYRYFAAPLPALVDAVRQLLYLRVVEIANRWQELLGIRQRFPVTWPEFRDLCAAAGQSTPSSLLLSYEVEGFNALHQDIRGEVFFPIQLVIVLSPRAASPADKSGFTGGEFILCDADRCQSFPAGLGDAVLFCTNARLVKLGADYALQPVKHGMSRIESGNRFAVGIPFHEFR